MVWKQVERLNARVLEFSEKPHCISEKAKESWTTLIASERGGNDDYSKAKYFNQIVGVQESKMVNFNEKRCIDLCEINVDNLPVDVSNRRISTAASISTLAKSPQEEIEDLPMIANFTFEIVEIIDKVYVDKTERWVKIAINYRDRYLTLEIEREKYSQLSKSIRMKHPQCFIFEENEFAQRAADIYGMASHLNLTSKYYFSGWHMVKNRWIYLNASMKNVSCDVELSLDNRQAKMFLPNFLQVSSKKEKLWLLLLYSFWAQLAHFYEVQHLDGLRTVLYVSAPTGTGKTSVAKILARSLLIEGAKVELRFDDTKASLQESLVNKRDIVCLVDDFYAKGSKLEDAEARSKASDITRIVGDGMVKGKIGPDRKPMEDRKYRGSVIATGEFIELNTQSSYLRCWLLDFPSKSIYFNQNLTLLQKNPQLAKAFVSGWIDFLENNQDRVLKEISVLHTRFLGEVRLKYPEAPPRFHTNVTTFFVLAELIVAFGEKNNLDIDKTVVFDAIHKEAAEQLKLLTSITPEELVKQALVEAIDNAVIKIAETEEKFKACEYDGFYDGQYISIITAKLEAAVEKYAEKKQYGIRFNEALKGSLADEGLLVKADGKYNFKYSKNRQTEPKRPRLYKLLKKYMELE